MALDLLEAISEQPLFRIYGFYASVLALKMLAMSIYTGVTRAKNLVRIILILVIIPDFIHHHNDQNLYTVQDTPDKATITNLNNYELQCYCHYTLVA